MSRTSRPQASADARRRSPKADPLSEAINSYLCRRQAEQLPVPQRRGRLPRSKRGSRRLPQAITGLAILTVASFVLFLVV
jgi:hypothetical protein